MTQWGLDNLFNPGKRHMDDEKRRLQSTREEVGDNSGGRRIDLEGGKVSISVPRRSATPAADGDGALGLALEAEDVPAVALTSDETEIEPLVVDDAARDEEHADAPAAAVEPVSAVDTREDAEPRPAEAEPEPEPEPDPEPAPSRRSLSANAWSRRG